MPSPELRITIPRNCWRQGSCCPRCSELCLTHGACGVNICWRSQWISGCPLYTCFYWFSLNSWICTLTALPVSPGLDFRFLSCQFIARCPCLTLTPSVCKVSALPIVLREYSLTQLTDVLGLWSSPKSYCLNLAVSAFSLRVSNLENICAVGAEQYTQVISPQRCNHLSDEQLPLVACVVRLLDVERHWRARPRTHILV